MQSWKWIVNEGLAGIRVGKLFFFSPPLFLPQDWESCASHSAFHLSSIYPPPLPAPLQDFLFFHLSPLLFSIHLSPLPALALCFPPPPLTPPFLTSHLCHQHPHIPQHAHTISCRPVKLTNRHNSPDKGIEALITSLLHNELKILYKKDVPLPLESKTKMLLEGDALLQLWKSKMERFNSTVPFLSVNSSRKLFQHAPIYLYIFIQVVCSGSARRGSGLKPHSIKVLGLILVSPASSHRPQDMQSV